MNTIAVQKATKKIMKNSAGASKEVRNLVTRRLKRAKFYKTKLSVKEESRLRAIMSGEELCLAVNKYRKTNIFSEFFVQPYDLLLDSPRERRKAKRAPAPDTKQRADH